LFDAAKVKECKYNKPPKMKIFGYSTDHHAVKYMKHSSFYTFTYEQLDIQIKK